MPSAPCSARATAATSRCTIAPTSAGSARCAAGNICSRCRNTPCMPRTSRCMSRAWPSFSLYDPFAHALGPRSTTPPARSMRSRARASSSRPCASVSQAMIDELCDSPEKHAVPACRRRPCRDLRAGRQLARREAAARPGRLALRRHRSRHDRGCEERRRSGRALFAARTSRGCLLNNHARATASRHFSLSPSMPRSCTRKSAAGLSALRSGTREQARWNPRSPSICKSHVRATAGCGDDYAAALPVLRGAAQAERRRGW